MHDKALPEWVYRGIGAAVSALSVWWWLLLFAARLANKNGGGKTHYLSICAIFKDESLSMREWIEYHKLVGVDHIYLYDNNSSDESVAILREYVDEDYVTLVQWNYAPPCQAEAYNDFKARYWSETQWVAFIDLDEYLCPTMGMSVSKWLKDYEGFPSVVAYWRMFGSSGLVDHDHSRLITEQYTVAWDRYNDIGKPLFNTRFRPATTTLKRIHVLPAEVRLFGLRLLIPPVNEFKRFIAFKSNRVGWFARPSDFSIQINHYSTKSYNEFFYSKRKRGDVGGFKNPRGNDHYVYGQMFATRADYAIYRFLPYLKQKMQNIRQ